MTWNLYTGSGEPRMVQIPPPPPWRSFPRDTAAAAKEVFQPPEGLTEAVDAALRLRRPLLLTGSPGVGKSTVIESVARELVLGPVLRWHITSRSTLNDALYRYDALGRLHASQLRAAQDTAAAPTDDIGAFVELGPLGTALLGAARPRALLIDEIDKSDLDLPSDLLNVLERGEYDIPELVRHPAGRVQVRGADPDSFHWIDRGRISCTEFPFIVMTSNGERDFPPPFLRRCIRFSMPDPGPKMLASIVEAHIADIGDDMRDTVTELVDGFYTRMRGGQTLATDQLLNIVYLLTREMGPDDLRRDRLREIVLRELSAG